MGAEPLSRRYAGQGPLTRLFYRTLTRPGRRTWRGSSACPSAEDQPPLHRLRSIFPEYSGLCMRHAYVLFDEPVLGLDASTRTSYQLLGTYMRQPQTIVLSTHLIDEAAGADHREALVIIRLATSSRPSRAEVAAGKPAPSLRPATAMGNSPQRRMLLTRRVWAASGPYACAGSVDRLPARLGRT